MNVVQPKLLGTTVHLLGEVLSIHPEFVILKLKCKREPIEGFAYAKIQRPAPYNVATEVEASIGMTVMVEGKIAGLNRDGYKVKLAAGYGSDKEVDVAPHECVPSDYCEPAETFVDPTVIEEDVSTTRLKRHGL